MVIQLKFSVIYNYFSFCCLLTECELIENTLSTYVNTNLINLI